MMFLITSTTEEHDSDNRFWSIQSATTSRAAFHQHIRALHAHLGGKKVFTAEFTADDWAIMHLSPKPDNPEREWYHFPSDNDDCWEHFIIRINSPQPLKPSPNIKRALMRQLKGARR